MTDMITSSANPRVKALVALRRRRVRDKEGVTLLEGLEETRLALDVGAPLRELYLCDDLMLDPALGQVLADQARATGAAVVRLARPVFEKVAYREGPDGVLAVVAAPPRPLTSLLLPADPLVLLSEGVEKPGNLGAMLRTADAAGVAAVVAADPLTDWGNPNVVRGSKGTVFSVPVAAAPLEQVLQWLAVRHIPIVAATPDTDVDYTTVDYTGPIAIAVGTEKAGLSDRALDAAHHRVRIPMAGRADSLNVATSAAIVLYEAVRQRRTRIGR